MLAKKILNHLSSLGDASNLRGMERFGIQVKNAFGIKMPVLRKIAKKYAGDHDLAIDLWQTGCHEARILATIIDNPKLVTREQMDDWTKDINSWDLCDQLCNNLFSRTPFVIEKILEYSTSEREFVKRTAFALMATYAVKGKKEKNEVFINLLPVIEREAWDNRNFVKKAVNWALRQIGKKNKKLCLQSLKTANQILLQNTASARWIANDAIRELNKKLILFND